MTTTSKDRLDDVWVGIDVGTQSVRALAVDSRGEVFGSGRQPLHSRRDGVRHEQDPEEWWRSTTGACRQALAEVRSGRVQAVAVDATSGTIALTGSDGNALTPALMYDDTRATKEVEQVNEVGDALWASLGYRRMQPAWALPKLIWLLRHYPDRPATARLTHQSDFVNRRLVGRDVPTDLSNALKTGVDTVHETWPLDVLDALQVPTGVLPDLVRPGMPIGSVCPAAAESTGLPVGTPVVSGTTDGCAAQIGAGALTVGSWNSVLGTTLVLKGVTRELIHDPLGVVYSHKAPNGEWLPGGASGTGAGAISDVFAGRGLADLDRRAGARGPTGVLTYPLVSSGERFPFVAPRAHGFTVGTAADEVERYAAILQGVALVERLCFDYLDLLGAPMGGVLSFTGGAARSRVWCQLRADIQGREVILPDNAEPALGMAVLAAASSGRLVAEVAAEMVRVRETIEPRPGERERYDASYLRLVEELEQRGWLQSAAADHARARTSR